MGRPKLHSGSIRIETMEYIDHDFEVSYCFRDMQENNLLVSQIGGKCERLRKATPVLPTYQSPKLLNGKEEKERIIKN